MVSLKLPMDIACNNLRDNRFHSNSSAKDESSASKDCDPDILQCGEGNISPGDPAGTLK